MPDKRIRNNTVDIFLLGVWHYIHKLNYTAIQHR